ncbi:hypothetical protein CRE_04356 [Caenorhabditis remanei]|uniref:G-protein coupled receptors family 1 profile domain-containing protein n=1 Tax=Caenorhabditis remanei TaxID=31234 RepID=E3NIA9_CAERE|nr:hypothetical protein CRE_04356 [Caenorhabditis remanei]
MPFSYIAELPEFLKMSGLESLAPGIPNNTDSIYLFPPKTIMFNGAKLLEIFLYIGFSYEFFQSLYYVHSLFCVVAYQSVVLSALTIISMLSLVLAWQVEKWPVVMQVALYCDTITGFFSMMMLYPLMCNQMLSRMYEDIWRRSFTKTRIICLVALCASLSCIAAVILIQTSEMQRFYIRKIGFVDSGRQGYQMLINRLFYIFPFGSIVCYIVLYFHIRRMTQQVMSRRTAENGKQRVFVQLFITVMFYGIMCALFEFINSTDFPATQKINLVAILNIINYLPEISLPLLLLVSNTEMRRRISNLLAPRSNQPSRSNASVNQGV